MGLRGSVSQEWVKLSIDKTSLKYIYIYTFKFTSASPRGQWVKVILISCRLASTCNHMAAVLFKLDYAWQNGYTNRACTSRPAEWTAPTTKKKQVIKPQRIRYWGMQYTIIKSHNAPVSHPTMHHSEQKCAHLCFEWCIVGCGTGALRDLWIWCITCCPCPCFLFLAHKSS